MKQKMKTLILGLGNDLLGDDAVGILAVRLLKQELCNKADLVECPLHGLALLEFFVGYDRAIIIDSIQTGRHPPGTICDYSPDDLDCVISPSPHYSGLPEMLALAKQLDLEFPKEIKIFALEVLDPCTIGCDLSEPVRQALPDLMQKVRDQLNDWEI